MFIFMKKVFIRINCSLKKLWLKLLYGKNIKFGKHFHFRKRLGINIDGGKLIIGDRVFFNNDCSINSHEKIIIGDDTLIGENVKMYDHNHIFNDIGVEPHKFKSQEIVIGKKCWICSNVTILKGTVIGDGAIISAGTIVNGIIPPHTIVKKANSGYTIEKIRQEETK